MPNAFPFFKWDENAFSADRHVRRMQPLVRHYTRALIQNSLAQVSPYLPNDDRELAAAADAISDESWNELRDEVMAGWISSDEGLGHPFAIKIHNDRLNLSNARAGAARSKGKATEADAGSPAAQHLAERLCGVRYEAGADLVVNNSGLLDPLLTTYGAEAVNRVVTWLLDSPEAGPFYRDRQFASCKSPSGVVASFVKRFNAIQSDALSKGAAEIEDTSDEDFNAAEARLAAAHGGR